MWDGEKKEGRLGVFEKGQSKRIWGELYKVVDSSDVVIQVCLASSCGIEHRLWVVVCKHQSMDLWVSLRRGNETATERELHKVVICSDIALQVRSPNFVADQPGALSCIAWSLSSLQ